MSTIRVGARPLFRLRPKDPETGIIDLSSATGLMVVLRRPGGELVELSASLSGGYIEARPAEVDIDQAGAWQAYARFTIATIEQPTLSLAFRVID